MPRPFYHPSLKEITLDGLLHALSDPTRRLILFNLIGCEGKSCSQTCDNLAPSTLSFHYKVLRDSGLVRSEKKGIEVMNVIRKDEIDSKFPGLLETIYNLQKTTVKRKQIA
ncbi:transcriptional regulator [Leptospira kobayashii]|uniref:ArsR family transcriptional regulator n=2 Tax=Leptospira TaxID=171 RepID=A0A4R9LK53_9LEPT|nr:MULTISPECIES: ArsR family transcriptional regulator [Leptospira]TGN07945.1 ArsR family transcriptional regulator [Leptospira ilyithenensis]BDA79232.1 transcriptional regulator [Leptospira kobayashii]